jgi:hypothetical protein
MSSVDQFLDCDASANNMGFAPAVARGMLGMWEFGMLNSGDTTAAARSLVSLYGLQPLGTVGAPVMSVGYASFISETNYFTSSMADQTTLSFWAVSRVVSASFPANSQANPVISCYGIDTSSGSAQAFGSTLNYTAGTGAFPDAGFRGSKGYNNGTTVAQNQGAIADVPLCTNWKFLACAINGAEGTPLLNKMWNMTDGTSITYTPGGTPQNNTQQTIRFGSAASTSNMLGSTDIAMCGVHNAGLTSAEIAKIYAQVKTLLQGKFPSVFPVL